MTMLNSEFREWIAFFELEFKKREKWEYYIAQIVSTLRNAHFKGKHKLSEALLDFNLKDKKEEEKETKNELKFKIKAWAKRTNKFFKNKEKK